jgi:hypothetical protein
MTTWRGTGGRRRVEHVPLPVAIRTTHTFEKERGSNAKARRTRPALASVRVRNLCDQDDQDARLDNLKVAG